MCERFHLTGPKESFSPIYSNIGIDGTTGALYAHFNRKVETVFDAVVDVAAQAQWESDDNTMYLNGEGFDGKIAFYDVDAFMLEWHGKEVRMFTPGKDFSEMWNLLTDGNVSVFQGYFYNRERRDPDPKCGFILGTKTMKGQIKKENGEVFLVPDENGDALAAITFRMLDFTREEILNTLKNAPETLEAASKLTKAWLNECSEGFKWKADTEEEMKASNKAIRSLAMNLTKAPGNLKEHISAYPNRGTYPTHFLWDSCFQNLAFELIAPQMARESLLQFASCQRGDGKFPQFLCSTWERPDMTQPALIGWAARRLEKVAGYENIGEELYTALEENDKWWLTQRMTKYGLIETSHGLETGWDDSPRFDDGPILSLDMNSFLIDQMRYTADVAEKIGRQDRAEYWRAWANELSAKMLELCYDAERNVFCDVLVSTGEQRSLLTPAAFLPLWAGVQLEEGKKNAMIQDYLLNPKYFYDKVIFPCVAYCEGVYQPEKWWRGPTWMCVAFLMYETLKRCGFEEMAKDSAMRMYKVILADGRMHELFNSQTGAGLGSEEQSWTAAIFLRLQYEIYGA